MSQVGRSKHWFCCFFFGGPVAHGATFGAFLEWGYPKLAGWVSLWNIPINWWFWGTPYFRKPSYGWFRCGSYVAELGVVDGCGRSAMEWVYKPTYVIFFQERRISPGQNLVKKTGHSLNLAAARMPVWDPEFHPGFGPRPFQCHWKICRTSPYLMVNTMVSG